MKNQIVVGMVCSLVSGCGSNPAQPPAAVMAPFYAEESTVIEMPASPPTTPNGPRLVTFGDSFTAGNSWAPEAAQALGMSLDNRAIGGTRFTDPAQFPSVMTYPFAAQDTVVMVVSANDAFLDRSSEDHRRLFEKELRATVAFFAALPTVQVYISNTLNRNQVTYDKYNYGPQFEVPYLQTIASVAADSHPANVHFMDLFDNYTQTLENLGPDNLHPNAQGFHQIEQYIVSQISH